jgi:hypothetical protein
MSMFGRVFRRAAYRLTRGAVRRRGLIAAAFVIVAGVIAISTFNLVSFPTSLPRGRASSGTSTDTPAYQPSDSEPGATASYIRGLQTGDAKLVWDAYSDRAARDLQRRGINVDETQRQLDQTRQNGNQIQGVNYVGSYPIPNGSMHFYVISRGGRARSDVAYVPYVFTLDATGKIERID